MEMKTQTKGCTSDGLLKGLLVEAMLKMLIIGAVDHEAICA